MHDLPQAREHQRTDRYGAHLREKAETWEQAVARRRIEQHQRDLKAAYLGAKRIADSERRAQAYRGLP